LKTNKASKGNKRFAGRGGLISDYNGVWMYSFAENLGQTTARVTEM